MSDLKIVFFGTPDFGVKILEELYDKDIVPTLIITAPDSPVGRGKIMTPPKVKVWGKENNVDVIQNHSDDIFLNTEWDLFIVASYGKILPKNLLDMPKFGVLNVHPSLLPKFRGSSPIVSAILEDDIKTGVSIMLLDEKMDHGPIVAQSSVEIEDWPIRASLLENILVKEGGRLLAEVIPLWIKGDIKAYEQDHDSATYTKKIKKEDGLINLEDDDYINFLKIQAFDLWPGTYFFVNDKRIKITEASYTDEKLVITKVIPEGKKEMEYKDFLRGLPS